ncbi:hypothetical protein ACFPRL_34815 [Pseudoclavibacter helvolus]
MRPCTSFSSSARRASRCCVKRPSLITTGCSPTEAQARSRMSATYSSSSHWPSLVRAPARMYDSETSSLRAFMRKVARFTVSSPLVPSSARIAVLTRSDCPSEKVSSRAGVSWAFEASTTCRASGLE